MFGDVASQYVRFFFKGVLTSVRFSFLHMAQSLVGGKKGNPKIQ